MGKASFGRWNADLIHRLFEKLAILADFDRVDVCTNQLDAVFFKNSLFVKLDRKIQTRLTANGGKQSVGPLFLDNGRRGFERKRFDIRSIRDFWIGHDRRRIGVDEYHFESFSFQSSASLRSRIIEFTCLSNDYRPRSDDQDLFNISSLRHY